MLKGLHEQLVPPSVLHMCVTTTGGIWCGTSKNMNDHSTVQTLSETSITQPITANTLRLKFKKVRLVPNNAELNNCMHNR